METNRALLGLGVLATSVLVGGCSAGARSPEATYHPEQPPRLSSVALALHVAEPVGAQRAQACSFDHAVVCWQVHAPFADVQREMAGALRGLDLGGVALTTPPGPTDRPAGVGFSHLDVSDATRHVRVRIVSEVAGTVTSPLPPPGVQNVIVQADPDDG